jgi:cardiolipin synthase
MTFTVPNLLSILRMGLIPLFVIALLEGRPGRALAIFVVAGLTDALDGLLARLLDQRSVLGMYLDPMADKLLLVTAYVMLSVPQLKPDLDIPIWVTALVITRDVVIVGVALVMHLAHGRGRFPPSLLSKVNTVLQVATVVLVLATALSPRLDGVATGFIFAMAGTTMLSALDYIYRYATGKPPAADDGPGAADSPRPVAGE